MRAPVGYRIIWWLGAVPWVAYTRYVERHATRDDERRAWRCAARTARVDRPAESCERGWQRLARRTGLIGTANSCGHSCEHRERGVLAGGPPGGAPGGGATNAAHTRACRASHVRDTATRAHTRATRSLVARGHVRARRRKGNAHVRRPRVCVCVCARPRGCSSSQLPVTTRARASGMFTRPLVCVRVRRCARAVHGLAL